MMCFYIKKFIFFHIAIILAKITPFLVCNFIRTMLVHIFVFECAHNYLVMS